MCEINTKYTIWQETQLQEITFNRLKVPAYTLQCKSQQTVNINAIAQLCSYKTCELYQVRRANRK